MPARKPFGCVVNSTAGSPLARELANAVNLAGAPQEAITRLTLIGSLPHAARDYSYLGELPDQVNRCRIPVQEPLVSASILEIINRPQYPFDTHRTENGYALRVQGGARIDEALVLRHARVQSQGTVADKVTTAVTHSYVDCLEWDAAMRQVGRVPVRAFHRGTPPSVGSDISYVRDQNGVAWVVNSDNEAGMYLGKAGVGWEWDVEGYVGKVTCSAVEDLVGTPTDPVESYVVYMPASSAKDPNVQPGDVIGWQWVSNQIRVAVTGNAYDAKIGSGELWFGDIGSIKGGWTLAAEVSNRFIVGYGDEYAPPGSTGGRHPIRPLPHDAAEIDPHVTTPVSASTTGITLQPAAVTVASSTTGITIGNHISEHYHTLSYGEGYAVDAIDDMVPPAEGHAVVEEGGDPAHTHAFDVGFGQFVVAPVTCQITTITLTHDLTDSGHGHSAGSHDHYLTDPGHGHDVPQLDHAGTLTHQEEDFRPPWISVMVIKRVGPDDD